MLLKNTAFLFILPFFLNFSSAQNTIVPVHSNTVWMLLPSIKYDAFCLLNTLIGDEFYVNYYPGVYKHFDSLFTPNIRKAWATWFL